MAEPTPSHPKPAPPQPPQPAKPTNPPTSTLTKAKSTLQYLYSPTTTPPPTSLRTRTLLRSARYIFLFAFWRLYRYAKYALTGALVAAVSGTALASVASGAAFLVAPTGVLGGAGVGVLWAVARFGFRRARRGKGEGDARRDERVDAEGEEGMERRGGRAVGEGRVEIW